MCCRRSWNCRSSRHRSTRSSCRRRRSWPATAGARCSPTGQICAASSSGPAMSGSNRSTRAHLELFRVSLEDRGLAAATIDRRLSTVCGSFRYAHIDGVIVSNPAEHVRRPTAHPAPQRGLDRGELARFLYAAERHTPMHAALAVLLGVNGLPVSEACATDVEDLGSERGHRILQIVGKANKPAVIPLVPRTARTIDLAVGERTCGPILLRADGNRLDSRTANRWTRTIGRRAGLDRVHPHMLRAAFIMAALDAGVPLRDVQIAARHADPRTTTIYDRRRESSTDTPHTPSSPTSQADNSSRANRRTVAALAVVMTASGWFVRRRDGGRVAVGVVSAAGVG